MKKVILCADDYGQNPSVSQGILELIKRNRISATSCLVTSPHWQEQSQWLKPYINTIDIGLHFNLTEKLSTHQSYYLPLPLLLFGSFLRLLNYQKIRNELNKQLDLFEAALGKPPDFMDGHQHIHQFFGIQDVFLEIFERRLSLDQSYIRLVYPKVHIFLPNKNFCFKSIIILMAGSLSFKRKLVRFNIPHNTTFEGIYSFKNALNYRNFFKKFLMQIGDRGMVMCHPGKRGINIVKDKMCKSRQLEFAYFASEAFLEDCVKAKINLTRMLTKSS